MVQISPSVEHVLLGLTQVPPWQSLPQHWTLDVHAPPAGTHWAAAEHVSVDGSQ